MHLGKNRTLQLYSSIQADEIYHNLCLYIMVLEEPERPRRYLVSLRKKSVKELFIFCYLTFKEKSQYCESRRKSVNFQ